MAADQPDSDSTFYARETWFLVESAMISANGSFGAGAVLQQAIKEKDGSQTQFVPLFTDEDLARRAIERLGNDAHRVRAEVCKSHDMIKRLFSGLIAIGVKRIAYDPGETIVVTIPIDNWLSSLKPD